MGEGNSNAITLFRETPLAPAPAGDRRGQAPPRRGRARCGLVEAAPTWRYPVAKKVDSIAETGPRAQQRLLANTGILVYIIYTMVTTTAKLFWNGRSQAVRLPKEFRFSGDAVTVRREGEAVILEPLKKAAWPPGFFDQIRITDSAFERPPQGEMPPPPILDAADDR